MLALPNDPFTALFLWRLPQRNHEQASMLWIDLLSPCYLHLDHLLVVFWPERFYGYKPLIYGPGQSPSVQVDRENAASLAKALYNTIAIPMALCCFIYFFLYFTYPRDRERAHMDSVIASELQQIELENFHSESGEHLDGDETTLLFHQDINFAIPDNASRYIFWGTVKRG